MKRFVFAVLALCAIGAGNIQAACFQPIILDGVLKTNVGKDGLVDYDSIRINKGGDLYEYIAFIEDADLKTCTPAEREAFWINAYNAHFIRLALARPQMKMVSDDFALFGEQFKVAQQKVSLNDIEHRIMRSSPKKGGPIAGVSLDKFDPRIHFTIVFGALDCPFLANRAYTAATLESALQANAVKFANNPKYIRLEDGKLVMNSILHWYMDDFAGVGGVPAYLSSLIDPKQRADADDLKAALSLATDYPQNVLFKFDWTLNTARLRPPAAAPAKKK